MVPDADPAGTAEMLRRMSHAQPLWVDVQGTSMGWSIPDGTRVRVEAADRPRRGEVWVFCDDTGVTLVHRCLGETTAGFRFQGDARVRTDPVVAADRLVGRVAELAPPRARFRWGATAGAFQRIPRLAWAWLHRVMRRGAPGS